MTDSLGDRMKSYELVYRNRLMKRVPVIIRVDGRAFHTYTRGLKPFDTIMRRTMIDAACGVADEMQGFECFYHQSDEVSFLLTDYTSLETSPWFDYVTQKVATISASVMSSWFNRFMDAAVQKAVHVDNDEHYKKFAADLKDNKKIAFFDARAFNVPKDDVTNCFLWRCKDWERNSLNMYAMQFFSFKQLHGKNASDRHDMLYGIGKNWAKDVPDHFLNGTFVVKDGNGYKELSDVMASYETVSKLIEPFVNKSNINQP